MADSAAGERSASDAAPTMQAEATLTPPQPLAQRLKRPFVRFMELETSSVWVLLAMTVTALVWANSPWYHSYHTVWHEWKLDITIAGYALFHDHMSLGHWVNDGLMVIFFFLVGMEIKREMVMGDLSTRARAMLPVMGALGGMVIPAGIYAAWHWGGPAISGWGIPMATDIAFAVAAMSVLGKRVPPPLKVFLLALAIADDLGAIMVIAIFYTAELHLNFLGAAIGLLAIVYGMNVAGVRSYLAYWAIGAVVWYCMLTSGVHATIAGVALGLLTPAYPDPNNYRTLMDRLGDAMEHLRHSLNWHEDHGGHKRHHAYQNLRAAAHDSLSPLDFLANKLERVVLFVIMPVFALANAGVHLDMSTLSDPLAIKVALAVGIGLVVGKPLGITLASWIAVRSGLAVLPRGVNWLAMFATGMLAGIGFTVALFISALAFKDPVIVAGSKVGILVGSTVACVVGMWALNRALPKHAWDAEPGATKK